MEYNSPLTIYNLPLAPTHILVIIKASVLETLGILEELSFQKQTTSIKNVHIARIFRLSFLKSDQI